MTTTILLSFAAAIVIAFHAGVFGAEITWRKQPGNVTDKELRVLELLWQHGGMHAHGLVQHSNGMLSDWTIRGILGDLCMRNLATWVRKDGAWYAITTEGIQICALNKRLRERAA